MSRDSDLLSLFEHPGWRHFVKQMEEGQESLIATAFQVPNENELFYRKGLIQQLALVINFEELTQLRINEEEIAARADAEHETTF